MRPATRWLSLAAALILLAGASAARAGNDVPAIDAFDAMFAGITDYTYDLHSHEIKGTATQNRVYFFQFLKPHYVKTLIVDGDGKGGGSVWIGGPQVNAHSGGLLAAAHVKIDLNDPRAVSLRGFTTPAGLVQNIVDNYKSIDGTLTQGDGGPVDGKDTDRLDLKVADPLKYDGVTECVLYIDRATHWPIRQLLYANGQIVIDQHFTDFQTNVGLKPSDFPF